MTGKTSECHTGFIISGEMMVRDSSGIENLIHADEAFEVAENHDAWGVGILHVSHWISGISPAGDVNAIVQGWFAEFFFLDL